MNLETFGTISAVLSTTLFALLITFWRFFVYVQKEANKNKSSTSTELSKLKQEHHDEIVILRDTIQNLTRRVDGLVEQAMRNRDTVNELNAKQVKLYEKIDVLEAENKKLEAQIEALQQQNGKTREELLKTKAEKDALFLAIDRVTRNISLSVSQETKRNEPTTKKIN